MKISLLVFMIIISVMTYSQDIPITFQVDMSMQVFDGNFPEGANVVVRGDFQTDAGDPGGNWQGNMFQLSDADNDTIYTGTFQIPSNFAGNNYIFKYVIVNPPAGDNWESINNREFTLTAPETVIPLDCFNHDCPVVYNPVTNTIIFTADISGILGVGIGGAFDPNQDSLLVIGLDDFWGYRGQNVIGSRKMSNSDPFHPGIYSTTLTVTSGWGIPNGEGDSTQWYFNAYPDIRFMYGGYDLGGERWYVYGPNGLTNTLPAITPQIYPVFSVSTIESDFTLNVDITGGINRYTGEPILVDSIEYVVARIHWLNSINPNQCWCPDDTVDGLLQLLTHSSGNIWSYHTTLPVGTNLGPIELRFGVMYPGADTVNGGVAYLNNEFPFETNHLYVLLDNPISVSNNWFGHLSLPDGVERIENIIPSDFELEQNYPNPFNPTTKIRYSIPEYSYVTLKVFNLLGEEIETLFNGEQMPGVYDAAFNASNLSSGIYFYSLQTRDFSSTKKMILLR